MSGLDEQEQEFVRRSDVFYSGLYLTKICAKAAGVFDNFKSGFLSEKEGERLITCTENILATKTPFMLESRAFLLSQSGESEKKA